VLASDYVLVACGYRFTILAGFWTDLASVPRICWRIAPPAEPDTCAPALIHDALYRTALLPRAECDRLFRELLLANGENKAKAWLLWSGVRVGGWCSYGGFSQRAKAMAHVLVEKAEGTTA